jgi:catechol 2,3-dioxygenase-like lactoylglutathione lyase family enzyme
MKINILDHVSIGTDRLEETRTFFCDLLGLDVGKRLVLKSVGYWLYAGEDTIVHLVEKGSNEIEDAAYEGGKEKPKKWEKAETKNLIKTGMDDYIAVSVKKSADLVQYMMDNSIAYWDRLLADRPLYQVFVRDPNGVILELNDYAPEVDKLDPMNVLGKD